MLLLFLFVVFSSAVHAVAPVQGTRCAPNQVMNRLTVYEDGSLEAECGPIPCGQTTINCNDSPSCRAENDVVHGLRWAASGKSLLLRCCSINVSNKIYVGTDVVGYGSYYQGGPPPEKERYGKNGAPEHDFIANMRAEQGGVRVWVYRIMCDVGEPVIPAEIETSSTRPSTTQPAAQEVEFEESNDEEPDEEVAEQQDEASQSEEKAFNPLRYRPPSVERASTGVHRH